MTTIDTPLLVTGPGPGGLVAAKLLSGRGVPSMVVGHETVPSPDPVELDALSLTILEPDGVLGVLRPYATSQDPFTITAPAFENGLKHHCVADMLITVYDGMQVELTADAEISGRMVVGSSTWDVVADATLPAASLGTELNQVIHGAADFIDHFLATRTTSA